MTKPTHEIRALWLIFKRETTYILGNKQQRMVVLVAPFAYAILMSFVYIRHQVTDMPVAVARLEDSSYARQMVRMLEASPKMTIAYQVNSEQEIHELLLEGKVDAGVVIPRDFSLRIKRGEDAHVGAFVNAGSLVAANTASTALNGVIQTFSTGIEVAKLQKNGMSHEKALVAAMPLKLSLKLMFNPGLNYSNFMVPGLFITILQQIILMGLALSMAGERETGSIGELFGISRRADVLFLGKALPYFIVNFLIAEVYMRVFFPMNEIPMEGSWPLMMSFTALFVGAVVALGIWVSSFCKTRLFATQLLMFIAMPSFVLSGFTWPLSAMPEAVQWLSQLLPMTHFVTSFRNIYLAGADLAQVSSAVIALLGFLAANVFLALWGIRRLVKIHG